jgi:hypothetical protein
VYPFFLFAARPGQSKESTWTMATCRSVPRRPTARDAAVITAGPVRKRTAMANVATLFPHAMIRGCSAMNRPARRRHRQELIHFTVTVGSSHQSEVGSEGKVQTKTEHSHSQPCVRQDGDGFQDDGRHLEVPPAGQRQQKQSNLHKITEMAQHAIVVVWSTQRT